MKLNIPRGVSNVTRKVIENFNKMDDSQFRAMYQVSKKRYALRVKLFKDPYMRAPLAKFAKWQMRRSM